MRNLALTLILAAAVCGCSKSEGRKKMVRKHVDGEWFRRSLVEDNLSHWLAAAPRPNGFFAATLDRQWKPADEQVGTLVSQSRLVFVMAAGHDVTGEQAYLDAARKGADFLLAHFRDGEHGGWLWSVDPDGEPGKTYKDSYGHAFVIFALAHATRVTGDGKYAAAAKETWETMKARFRDEAGGFRRQGYRDWSGMRGCSQNPMMHLFEALLALHAATGDEAIRRDASGLVEFIFGRLYQPAGGYLPEAYDADWKPVPDDAGGYIDLGHQFEWAFLLSQAARQGLDAKYLDIARRLLDYGMAHGYDAASGGIFGSADYSGRARSKSKGWWQQCEHLRALMRHASDHGRDDLWPAFEKSLAFVREHFLDAEYGGWYGSYDPDRPQADQAKGSPWKTGYHATGMYLEALRIVE
ncbi:MAG TPA: AGE family epimerase/isomerase [Phycisphaerae bacterium]|nr:AGE family epimerase/isomerase [Phycisphaerae bacterium]